MPRFPYDITLKEFAESILKNCSEGYFDSIIYREDEFYLCPGDCQSCSVGEIMRFLLELDKHKEDKLKKISPIKGKIVYGDQRKY